MEFPALYNVIKCSMFKQVTHFFCKLQVANENLLQLCPAPADVNPLLAMGNYGSPDILISIFNRHNLQNIISWSSAD